MAKGKNRKPRTPLKPPSPSLSGPENSDPSAPSPSVDKDDSDNSPQKSSPTLLPQPPLEQPLPSPTPPPEDTVAVSAAKPVKPAHGKPPLPVENTRPPTPRLVVSSPKQTSLDIKTVVATARSSQLALRLKQSPTRAAPITQPETLDLPATARAVPMMLATASATAPVPLPGSTANNIQSSQPVAQRLECAVQPGRAVGPFVLGTPVGSVVAMFRDMENSVPYVECMYDDSAPLRSDIVLNLPSNGICLRFDPASQRLKLIELWDFSKLALFYKDVDFNSHRVLPTFVSIYKLFGPTYPGEFSDERKQYTLTYPGVSFVFPIPDAYIPLQSLTDLPLSFPDGTTPVLNRVYVFTGSEQWQHAVAPRLKFDIGHVVVKIGEGIAIPNHPRRHNNNNSTTIPISLAFGTPTQDVLDALGKPEGVCAKDDDQMSILGESPDTTSNNADDGAQEDETGDYFWNYFTSGFDILFSGTSHTIKKLILHMNPVGHWDFTQYAKCQFVLGDQERAITADSTWEDIQRIMHSSATTTTQPPRPVVHNRGGHQNPFGPTCFYGYPGVVFEVINNTGCLASVTLFETNGV